MAVSTMVTTPKPSPAQQMVNKMNTPGAMGPARMGPGNNPAMQAQYNAKQAANQAANVAKINALSPEQRQAFTAWIQSQAGNHPATGSPAPGGTVGTQGSAPAGQPGQVGSVSGGPIGTNGAMALPGAQEGMFLDQQSSINENANSQLATNIWQQGQTRNQFDTQATQNQALQLQERQGEAAPMVSRGILGSGIQARDINNMYTAQAARRNAITTGRTQAMHALFFQNQQIENARDQALAALRTRHQQALDAAAAKNVR